MDNTITILGGGPAGVGVAYYCSQSGISFNLYDAGPMVGGNCTTYNIDGFLFDSGAHRFHDKNKTITDEVKRVMGSDLIPVTRPSQIFVNNRFINFPPSAYDLIMYLGFFSSFFELIKLTMHRIINRAHKIENFREYVINRYGYKISNLFMIGYSEKLWGKPSDYLSVEISGKRLKGINLREIFRNIFLSEATSSKHLDGTFYYPVLGIGSIFTRMCSISGSRNYNMNSAVTSIKHNGDRIVSITINNSRVIDVDSVVSSIPIDQTIRLLDPSPPPDIIRSLDRISYRDLTLIIFLINKESINCNGSMYFPSKDYIFTRISEPRNRSEKMSPDGKTSLVVEVPCCLKDSNVNNNLLSTRIENDLIDLGLFNSEDVIGMHRRDIPKAYPILDTEYKGSIDIIEGYLAMFSNLRINGRNGKFKYTHIHDHLSEARDIVLDVIDKK